MVKFLYNFFLNVFRQSSQNESLIFCSATLGEVICSRLLEGADGFSLIFLRLGFVVIRLSWSMSEWFAFKRRVW